MSADKPQSAHPNVEIVGAEFADETIGNLVRRVITRNVDKGGQVDCHIVVATERGNYMCHVHCCAVPVAAGAAPNPVTHH